MDVVSFVDILSKALIAVCALLAAVAVIFLVVRPLIDPHWKDGRDEVLDDSLSPGDAHRGLRNSTIQGT